MTKEPQPWAPSIPINSAHRFAGMTAGDFARDGAALALLLLSLTLRWDFRGAATERIDVVLITILSIISLAIPVMARLGALGQRWTRSRIRLVRLLVNVPYFAMVVVYLMLDLVLGGDRHGVGGVDIGLSIGLTGALLAAQPRNGDLDESPSTGGLWRAPLAAIAGVTVLGAVTSVVLTLVRERDLFDFPMLISAMFPPAVTLVLVVWPILGTLQRDASWRLTLLALGGAAVGLLLFTHSGDFSPYEVESVHFLGFGTVFWPPAAAVAAAPSVRLAMREAAPTELWFGAARRLLLVTLATGGLLIASIIKMFVVGVTRDNPIFSLVFLVLYLSGALIVYVALAQGLPRAASIAYVVAGQLLLIGILNFIVTNEHWMPNAFSTALTLAIIVPIALIVMVRRGDPKQILAARPGVSLPPAGRGQTTAPFGDPSVDQVLRDRGA